MLDTCKFVLSLDIGGVNTKSSLVCLDLASYVEKSVPKYIERYENVLMYSHSLFCSTQYFPFWQKTLTQFTTILRKLRIKTENYLLEYIKINYPEIQKIQLMNSRKFFRIKQQGFEQISKGSDEFLPIEYNVVITITAELSDAFSTKKEGITIICQHLQQVFNSDYVFLIDVNGDFISVQQALSDYLSVSASNWVATSLVFGENEELAILLDMGTTTLDLIPIRNGRPVPIGKNDVDRLINWELYYTGVLRPPIPTIVTNIPFRDTLCPISFERFALMADVYMILGQITESEYLCDTADGRGKSLEECYARLARIICGDSNIVTKGEMDTIAEYAFKVHKEMVQDAIQRLINQFIRRFLIPPSKIHFIVTGLGAKILLIPVLKEMSIQEDQIFCKSFSEKEHVISTAICLGIVFLKHEIQRTLVSNRV